MKKSKLLLVAVMATVLAIGGLTTITSCGGSTNNTPSALSGDLITFAENEITIYVGESQRLSYTLANDNLEIVWTSSDSKIASVRNGNVTAKGEGEATITATINEKEYKVTVKVKTRTITISQDTATIDIDSGNLTLQLEATASDGGNVVWTSSDPSIATVVNGLVTATGEDVGEVSIIASKGAAMVSCKVIVTSSSRPEDYYKLTKTSNLDTVADPGVWHFFGDGTEGGDYTFVKQPYHQNNSVYFKMNYLGLSNGKYFYARYQPTLELNKTYTLTATLEFSSDTLIKYGSDNKWYSGYVYANVPYTLTYVGTVNDKQPFSIRLDCEDLEANKEVDFNILNYKVEEGDKTDGAQDKPHTGPFANATKYEVQYSTNAGVCLNRGQWFYLSDGSASTDFKLVSKPMFENNKVTIEYENIQGMKPVNQLRYQPDFEVGTYYKLTAKVKMNQAGSIVYGSKDSGAEYYQTLQFENANEEKEIAYEGYVYAATPFSINMIPTSYTDNFKVEVSEIKVEKAEAPVVETTLKEAITKKNNATVCAEKGVWAYTAPEAATVDASLTGIYDDDSIKLVVPSSVDGDYQLRYQPDLEVGTEYTVTFDCKVEGADYFLFGNDYKSSKT